MVSDHAAGDGTGHDAGQEGEQVELRRLHRELELVDQIERVIGAEAGTVYVLGKEQGDQDRYCHHHLPARQSCGARCVNDCGAASSGPRSGSPVAGVPATNLDQHEDGDQRQAREPRDARLSMRHHHEGGEQWTRSGANIPAHLKQRLREAVTATGRHASHPRCFGMEDGRAHADQHRREQDRRIG